MAVFSRLGRSAGRRAWRTLRRRQPSLRSRITAVFFLSFIAFVAISGTALVVTFHYQLRRYTEFVGYRYAVQLARMLETYYDNNNSWRNVTLWLRQNFAPSQTASSEHSQTTLYMDPATAGGVYFGQDFWFPQWSLAGAAEYSSHLYTHFPPSSLWPNGAILPTAPLLQREGRVFFYYSLPPARTAWPKQTGRRSLETSALLSFCLISPLCLPYGLPYGLPYDLPYATQSSRRAKELPSPWAPTPFRAGIGLAAPRLGEAQSQWERQPQLLQAEDLPGWIFSEDRPELFARKQLPANNLLGRLQSQYSNVLSSNEQVFVLFAPDSKVIASNLSQATIARQLGKTWDGLRRYIRQYASSSPATATATATTPAAAFPLQSQANRWPKDKNIFVIKNRHGSNPQAVGFLYATSIVSPIWKRLNYQINAVILGVALLSCLVIATIYWLIDRYHLRKLFMPLQSLSNIATEVRKGNTQARVQSIPRESELALVTEQFNQMLDSLAREVMLREQQCRDVAHELRTPITIISGELQLIQEGVYQADAEKIQGLMSQVQQLQRLVQDLEILYRASQNDSTPYFTYFESLSASQLLGQAYGAFATQMKQKGIQFSMDLGQLAPTASQPLRGDASRLQQVFGNCLVNAMRYTPTGGQIELAARYLPLRSLHHECARYVALGLDRGQNYILFSIADSGCGIPEEQRQLVFERFFRVDSCRNYQSGGSGLGLAISQSFIKLHGGVIWTEESHLPRCAVQRGAKFCFALPCWDTGSQAQVTDSSE